jgi:multidrug efflux pump subunit AcrA (membrane-fusion protein)
MADLASRVAERSAMLESARAALVQAERTHASNESLAAQKFISPNALESSAAALATARAQLNAAQASLDTTRVGLRDATLVAPISGIVSKRHAVPGEKLSVEQQVLSIVDLAKLELAGSVGTHEVSRIAPGLAVQVQVEGMDTPVAGRVARNALARATLNDEAERLTLPDSAVGSTSGQDHVWVIENGTLARRAVTLGRRDPRAGRVEVLQGVTPASQVLAARFDNLREGAKASVAGAKGSGSAAAVASAAASAPLVK